MKLTQVLESFPIMEMLNTKLDEPVVWEQEHQQDICKCSIDNGSIGLKLVISAITYKQLSGLRVGFLLWNGTDYVEHIGAVSTISSAKVIGAVTNALLDRLNDYEWDFIVADAKDAVAVRMKLYTRIVERIARSNSWQYGSGVVNNIGIAVVSKEHSCQDIIDNIRD